LLWCLGAAGVILCAAGIVESWMIRPKLLRSTTDACARIDKVLGVMADGLGRARASLEKARAELAALPQPDKGPPPVGGVMSRLRLDALRTLAPRLAPELQDPVRTLDAAVEAAVVVSSLLEGFENMSLGKTSLDADKMRELATRVKGLGDTAEKLRTSLGATPDKAEEHTSRLELALPPVIAKIADMSEEVQALRERVTGVDEHLSRWLTTGAIITTVLLVWSGIGQVGLLVNAWSLRRKESSPETSSAVPSP
jgi:hypothetical protein